MKQILDTFGRWGFFALHTILLIAAALLIGFEPIGPWYIWIVWKFSGVLALSLWGFIGSGAFFAEMFPTSVMRFWAYMREHVNTDDE